MLLLLLLLLLPMAWDVNGTLIPPTDSELLRLMADTQLPLQDQVFCAIYQNLDGPAGVGPADMGLSENVAKAQLHLFCEKLFGNHVGILRNVQKRNAAGRSCRP